MYLKMNNGEYMYKNFSFIGVYIWNDIQDHISINTMCNAVIPLMKKKDHQPICYLMYTVCLYHTFHASSFSLNLNQILRTIFNITI